MAAKKNAKQLPGRDAITAEIARMDKYISTKEARGTHDWELHDPDALLLMATLVEAFEAGWPAPKK